MLGISALVKIIFSMVAVSKYIYATMLATAITFTSFPFIRWTHHPTNRTLLASRSSIWCFFLFGTIEIYSNYITINNGDFIALSQIGLFSGALTGLSSASLWLIMVARDPIWKRNVERDHKRVVIRTILGAFLFLQFVLLLFFSDHMNPVDKIRGLEFTCLTFGICAPFIFGKEFIWMAMQVRPLLN